MRTGLFALLAVLSPMTLHRADAPYLYLYGCQKADFAGEIGMRVTRPNAAPSDMTFEAAGGNARVDLAAPGAPASHAIVRADGKAVLVVDAQKAWMDLDMTKAGAAVAEADPGGTPAVTKTGKHETIAGAGCEVWEIKHESGKRTEACIAEGLVAFDFGRLLPGGLPSASSDELRKKKLFPLRSIERDAAGAETSRMEVTRIERKSIDRARFEVPSDYTHVASPPAK